MTVGQRSFVIVGAGGHGREVLDIVDGLGLRDRFAGFVDDSTLDEQSAQRIEQRGTSVVGTVEWLAASPMDFAIGIGSSASRRAIDTMLTSAAGERTALTLVHPNASIGSEVRLAPGVIIGSHSSVTTNVAIGRHSHVNVGCAVQHDSIIGDYVTMSPGVFINGDVRIGHDVFIGTGAIITRGCTVHDGATIGAGAVVLADVAAGSLAVGMPARARSGR